MQTLGFEAVPATHFLGQPVRHGHAPMHACHTVDPDRDAASQWLTLHPPLKLSQCPVKLCLVGFDGEEAFGDLFVQPGEPFAEVLWRR